MSHWELLIFFFAIAFVYASVGFGGGSSYLAILALYHVPFQEMKLTALICNIIVVTGGTMIYIRREQVEWRKVLPLVMVSVPMAFLGARIKLSQDAFFVILGCCLIAAAVLLWIKAERSDDDTTQPLANSYLRDCLLGGVIGMLSGMVGIGGGIFLSPILNLMKWDTPKKVAATASFFILCNSIAGITGQLSATKDTMNYGSVGLLCAAVLIGGQLGSRIGTTMFNPLVIRRVTAAVVLVAGIEVLHKHLPWFN